MFLKPYKLMSRKTNTVIGPRLLGHMSTVIIVVSMQYYNTRQLRDEPY